MQENKIDIKYTFKKIRAGMWFYLWPKINKGNTGLWIKFLCLEFYFSGQIVLNPDAEIMPPSDNVVLARIAKDDLYHFIRDWDTRTLCAEYPTELKEVDKDLTAFYDHELICSMCHIADQEKPLYPESV